MLRLMNSVTYSDALTWEGEAPAEPLYDAAERLSRSFALPGRVAKNTYPCL